MEVIFTIIIFILILCAPAILSSLRHGMQATGQTPTGGRDYIGSPQLKLVDDTLAGTDLKVKKIMFRGRMPNTRAMEISFALSALDTTEGLDKAKPIFSLLSVTQEPHSACYQMTGNLGPVGANSATTGWIRLGAISPNLIQPAFSGNREIRIFLRMFNSANPPLIHNGWSDGSGEVILSKSIAFNYPFKEKGYEEAFRDKEEAQALSLKIGVAVAMSDGSLDDREGATLKGWIQKEIAGYSEAQQKKLKDLFNAALKEGFADAQRGILSLSPLASRLSEIGDTKTKYDAIELCLNVMAADGIADPNEMSVIHTVARNLNLDMDEIEKMREKVTLDLNIKLTSEEGMESLVGIDPSWSDEKKRKHLRVEFQKWSNRLNTLAEGADRDTAQNMLDTIATLRKKYG